MLFTNQNVIKKEEENISVTFTQKCILMASISQDKSKILLTSFNDLPVVKLYTTKVNTKDLIYSKIKGVLCFMSDKNKDPEAKKYYLRIYSIKKYSLLFNIELSKNDLEYYIKIRNDLYCFQAREFLIGFKFNSKENAEKFYSNLKDGANKEIINQNEKAYNIDSSKLNINIYKEIIDSIKDELKKDKKKNKVKLTISTRISINDDNKSDFIDFSSIYYLYMLMNNVEFDNEDNKLNFFADDNYFKKNYMNLISQFNKANNTNYPMQIIDKDFNNILNKQKYIDFMIKNIIQTIKEKEDLMKYKTENIKKQNKDKQLNLLTKGTLKNPGRKLSTDYRKIKTTVRTSAVKNLSVGKRKVNNNIDQANYNSAEIRHQSSLEVRKPKNSIKEVQEEFETDITKKEKDSKVRNSKANINNNIKKTVNFNTVGKNSELKLKTGSKIKEKEKLQTEKKKSGVSAFSLGGIFKKKK